ncbi:hypothetical protein AB0903_11695 [Streptomyces sp. NPDC048389]|uniref:hypothetical protein n=1 Tax=Streptomyces sp. NPDC048389 TaxID=3154622 RepID=UPI00345373BC
MEQCTSPGLGRDQGSCEHQVQAGTASRESLSAGLPSNATLGVWQQVVTDLERETLPARGRAHRRTG